MDSTTIARNWYVAYTFPKAEKSIQKNLEIMKITSFLPLYEVIRRWSDRRKKILAPLFPNYIFIYSSHHERYKALKLKGIVKYVSFGGKPAIIENEQIESIKKIIIGNIEVNPIEYLKPGKSIKIIQGPFLGAEGILEEVKGGMRLIVQLNCLNRAVSVHVSANMVSPLIS